MPTEARISLLTDFFPPKKPDSCPSFKNLLEGKIESLFF
jgi:hypothetical protein